MVYGYGWRPYVPVAERRRRAARKVATLRKKGRTILPVHIDGRQIARTFWGKAWCDNLESYSDYANRLPRGRTYVRNGSVVDLQIKRGRVTALVSGTSLYEVDIAIKPTAKRRWRALADRCAGRIDSVVELLQGKFSKGVMDILARRDTGLFPAPREISLACSCPDWATMCKHVAAVLYGVGARLDDAPETLFVLRDVDHLDLVAEAGTGGALGEMAPAAKGQVLKSGGLSKIFGIDLDEDEPSSGAARSGRPKRPRKKARTPAPRKTRPTKRGAAAPKASTRRATAKKPRRGATATSPTTSKAPKRAAAAGAAAKRKARPRGTRRRKRRITAGELIELGVPRTTFQNWVTSGVLARTSQRGVYLATAAAEQRIKDARRRRRRGT